MTAFGESGQFTVGVEEEFQLIDPDTGQLVSAAPDVLEALGGEKTDRFQPELFQSMIETASPVCKDVDAVRESLENLRGQLADVAEELGVRLAAGGTHPMDSWEDQDQTRKPRYDRLVDEMGIAIRQDLVFGQHVHVAVGTTEQAIATTNGLRRFLPLMSALAANSPFWRGHDTNLAVGRLRVSAGLPRSGPPRRFEDFADFERAFHLMRNSGAIEAMSDVWWDVRPRPEMGTVEVRIADVSPTIEHSLAQAALVQALAARMARRGPREVASEEALSVNRWRAIRHGLDAELVTGPEGDCAGVDAMLERTLAYARGTIDELGLDSALAPLERRVEGTSPAQRQREVYEKTGQLREVALDVADRTET